MSTVWYKQAERLSSASLHEAAGRIGALPASIKPHAPFMRVYGMAFPVQCVPGDNLWLHRAVYAGGLSRCNGLWLL
jgi:4-hydroxy-4-methyl-2-oxoglutarate aldolase